MLDHFYIMYMECQNDINLPQLFLWLQEKSLFSMGALLYNPTPGVKFSSCDLIRNLLLSTITKLSQQDQEAFYSKYWIPLEKNFDQSNAFDLFIAEFLENCGDIAKSQLEDTILSKISPKDMPKLNGVVVYTKFYSYFESKQKQQSEIQQIEQLAIDILSQLLQFFSDTRKELKN